MPAPKPNTEVVVEAIEPNAQPQNEADVVAEDKDESPKEKGLNAQDSRVFIVNGQKVDCDGKLV